MKRACVLWNEGIRREDGGAAVRREAVGGTSLKLEFIRLQAGTRVLNLK
jgi:hypothetical protein